MRRFDALQKHQERVTAEPADKRELARRGGQRRGDLLDRLIRGTVTTQLIETLEVVDVDQQKRPFWPFCIGVAQPLAQAVVEATTVPYV